MKRILKPYTIIPSSLYVKRIADYQIEEILEDMQRPGYVLVSRQMGKTNLLLNAQESLKREDDIFIYLDLSNTFADSKGCFENMINITLELNQDKLNGLKEQIYKYRNENQLLPNHSRHLEELKLILNRITGRLIFFLDEIDALTKIDYSDEIFAQIRSIYFSRKNNIEFERLGYILSGVVEPKEIIKNQDISPFNIGQKIYLNDFSFEEFCQFLDKGQLKLKKEVVDYIYEMTNGNPRITWDICSDIEKINDHKIVEITDVKDIINKLYLISFDKPPIDNIRDIVKKDIELSDAILELHYDDSVILSDRIKNKLYLSGIINYDGADGRVKIKNEIIKKSLSENWIKTFRKETNTFIKIALDYYANEQYQDCFDTFMDYLNKYGFKEEESATCYYYMGFCKMAEGNFQEALHYFNQSKFNSDEKYYYLLTNFQLICNNKIGCYEQSLEKYKTYFEKLYVDKHYIDVLNSFYYFNIIEERKEFLNESQKIIENIVDTNKDFSDETTKISYINICKYFLAKVFILQGNTEKAIDYLNSIYNDLISNNLKVRIGLDLLEIEFYEDKDNKIQKEIVNLILEEVIEINKSKSFDIRLIDDNIFSAVLVNLLEKDSKELFEKLTTKLIKEFEYNIGDLLLNYAIYLFNRGKKENLLTILNEIINNKEKYQLSNEKYFNSLKYLCFLEKEKRINLIDEYIEILRNSDMFLDNIDIDNFGQLINFCIIKQDYQNANKYLTIIKD